MIMIVRENNLRKKTGGHTCYVCKKFVPVGEEGYGQQRICMDCHNINNLQDIIATKEVEDWRGLVRADTQSKGDYLQKDTVQNEFLLDSNIYKMLIMRNESNLSLRPVKIGKDRYSLTNTCAFDSILQLFIAAYFDTETINLLVVK